MSMLTGTRRFEFGDSTREVLTISIDPAAGNDDAAPPRFTTQAEIAAYGSFKTMEFAAKSLPQNILHRVVFSLANGVHTITDGSIFGDLSRLLFGWNNPAATTALDHAAPTGHGHIAIRSANGYLRVAGTGAMASSSPVNDQVVASVNPGFSVNQYRGYFMRPLAGTAFSGGEGVKVIRNHSGTTFNLCGRFNGTVTSFEIVAPAASLNLDALTRAIVVVRGPRHNPAVISCECLYLEEVDFVRTSTAMTLFADVSSLNLNGCRFFSISLAGRNAWMMPDNVVLDGQSRAANVVRVDGGWWRPRSSESSWLVRGGLSNGIQLTGAGQGNASGTYMDFYKGCIDDNALSGILLNGPATYLSVTQGNAEKTKGSGNGRYGVEMLKGSYYRPGLLNFASDYLTGALGEIALDGTILTYADVTAEADKLISGAQGSVIEGLAV